MDLSQIHEQAKALHLLVAAGRIISAVDMLRTTARNENCPQIIEGLEDVAISYKSMLDYYVGGANDPQRQQIYRKLTTDLHNLIDQCCETLDSRRAHPTLFYETKCAMAKAEDVNFATLNASYREAFWRLSQDTQSESRKEHATALEEASRSLFDFVWASPSCNAAIADLHSFITDEQLPLHHRELLFGAVLLAISTRYRESYVRLLMKLCMAHEPKIKARAIVSLLLTMITYPERCIELADEIEVLIDEGGIRKNLFSGLITVECVRAISIVDERTKKDIFPILSEAKKHFESKSSDDDTLEETLFSKTKLMSTIKQLEDWGEDGIDITFSSMRYLKGFPFFAKIAHWFLPFYKEQPDIQSELATFSQDEAAMLMHKIPMLDLCDSDKYSSVFCFAQLLSHGQGNSSIPPNFINRQMSDDEQTAEEAIDNERKIKMAVNRFVQDAYRFFALFPRRAEFVSPFDELSAFTRTKIFRRIFNNAEHKKMLAGIMAKYKIYDEAAYLYDGLLEADPTDLQLALQTGFCHFRLGHTQRALDLFLKADLVDDSQWVKRKIAQCYMQLEQPHKAIYYLEQLRKTDEKNLSILTALADVYFEIGEFDKALTTYFEVDFAKPNDATITMKIAQSAFYSCRIDVATRYMKQLHLPDATPRELITIGHVRLCEGRRKDAVEIYRSAIAKSGSEATILTAMNSDAKYLILNGVDADEIPLVTDAVLREG